MTYEGYFFYRTGTIQPGDKLLAIDNVRMDTCTIEDAAQVLQNAADIVRLRIRKDEAFAGEQKRVENGHMILHLNTKEKNHKVKPLKHLLSEVDYTSVPRYFSYTLELYLSTLMSAVRISRTSSHLYSTSPFLNVPHLIQIKLHWVISFDL